MVPYPVCKRHAIVIYENMRDELNSRLNMYRSEKQVAADNQANRDQLKANACVYYLSINGVIKIGTSARLVQRVESMRGYQHDVLAVEPGHFEVEKRRHEQFKDLRIGTREDFRVDPRLMAHIEAVKEEHGEPRFDGVHVVF
jgi:hypothetical protein